MTLYEDPPRTCQLCQCDAVRVQRFDIGWRHDACIACLPGVTAACCGHGADVPYVYEHGGLATYGKAALARMCELGGSPPARLTVRQAVLMLRHFHRLSAALLDKKRVR